MRIIITLLVSAVAWFSLPAVAELKPLDEAELQNTTGQEGITQSAKLDFAQGTRLSYANPDADYKEPAPGGGHYWLVVDNITGSLEMKKLKTDYVNRVPNGFNEQGEKVYQENVGAVQYTLPELEYDNFRTDGLYLGPGKEVGDNHRFILGMEINGKLQFDNTTMTVFAIGE